MTATMEIYGSVYQCVECVVLANTYILARVVLRAALANDDVACNGFLATPNLNTKSLCCRFASVLRTTYTFFMCHIKFLLELANNLFNFYLCELLAMTVLLAIVFAALHLENNDLVAFNQRFHNFHYYFCSFYGRCSYGNGTFVVNEKHFLKFYGLAFLNLFQVVYEKFLTGFSLKLLTVDFYNCVHFNYYKRLFREARQCALSASTSLYELKSGAKLIKLILIQSLCSDLFAGINNH